MKKKRNTAVFVHILCATLFALVSVFSPNFARATEIYAENSQLMCSFTDNSVNFVAKFCKNCTPESLETTDCQLTVEDGQCVYSAQCLPGYDSNTLDDTDPADPSCEPCTNNANVATWGNNCLVVTCDEGYININNACVLEDININYDCGTGTGVPPEDGFVTYGNVLNESLSQSAGTCAKQYMNFAGWSCENADGGIYAASAYNSTKEITCHAQWTPTTYSITYNMDGGTNFAGAPDTYTVESDTITLGTPTRDGYAFNGWKDSNNNTVTRIVHGSTGNMVLTAQWTANTYDIVYDLDGGEFKTSNYPQTYTYDVGLNSLVSPYKFGLAFGGWYDNAEFDGDPIESINTNTTGTVHLYAKWIFTCESGKWLHLGEDDDDKFCLYESKPGAPTMVVGTKTGKFYMMLTRDASVPVHAGSSKKLRVEYKGVIYNAHDASVDVNQ